MLLGNNVRCLPTPATMDWVARQSHGPVLQPSEVDDLVSHAKHSSCTPRQVQEDTNPEKGVYHDGTVLVVTSDVSRALMLETVLRHQLPDLLDDDIPGRLDRITIDRHVRLWSCGDEVAILQDAGLDPDCHEAASHRDITTRAIFLLTKVALATSALEGVCTAEARKIGYDEQKGVTLWEIIIPEPPVPANVLPFVPRQRP